MQLNLYEEKQHEEYSRATKRLALPPHIFWIAATAYSRMLADKTTQCIAVSGESGAGKTESTKYMIQHIIHLCKNDVDKELQNKIIEVLMHLWLFFKLIFLILFDEKILFID